MDLAACEEITLDSDEGHLSTLGLADVGSGRPNAEQIQQFFYEEQQV